MHRMFDKYQDAEFGTCPRVCCQGQHCLPVGMSDQQRSYPVNVYCPRCQELYYPRSTKQAGLDGAYFGTTFAHMFLLTYPDLIPRKSPTATLNSERYIPKIYGFRIHQDSSYYKLR
jgi:casein kinase II subunit beta